MSFPTTGSGGFGFTSSGIVVANLVVVEGPDDGIFIYNGTPALGNLIISAASQAGVDAFGNSYPIGIAISNTGLPNEIQIRPDKNAIFIYA